MLQAGLKLVFDRPTSGEFRCLSGTNSCPVCVTQGKIVQLGAKILSYLYEFKFCHFFILKRSTFFMQYVFESRKGNERWEIYCLFSHKILKKKQTFLIILFSSFFIFSLSLISDEYTLTCRVKIRNIVAIFVICLMFTSERPTEWRIKATSRCYYT